MAMYRKKLIPDDFQVPDRYHSEKFIFIPLTINLCELDFDAVLDNDESKTNVLPPKHTLHQNLIDLGYHQKEMQKKASFTYSILTPDEKKCMGCVYIYPSDIENFDADIEFWVRNSCTNLYDEIKSGLESWIETDWKILKINKLW